MQKTIEESSELEMCDEELARRTLADQEYFVLIVDRYKFKLYNFIRRLTNISDEDAEDLLQEVFLKIYLNLNAFDSGLKFSSWAYSIARNHVISSHRKFKARAESRSTSLELAEVDTLMADFDMERSLDLQLLRVNIFKILDCLEEKYREVLVLKYFEEKDYNEISDIVKKPPGTVGSLINKAKKEFKKELERQEIKKTI